MTIAAQIEAYLTRSWGGPVTVSGLSRIPGGASRETYRFDAEQDGVVHRLILRREPAAGLIDTESATEFRAYQSAQGIVPVPRAIALEPDGAELGRPFFLMERIDGGQVVGAFARDPFGMHGETLGEAFFGALGRLAAFDPTGSPLAGHVAVPAPEDCWRVALDYWEGVIDADAAAPLPIVRAAIRRLRASPPPPPAAVRIVHGDYRSGNVMHDGAGGMLAMLDWEMAHIGDPLEDLGWALDPIWHHFEPGRVCGMTTREAALAAWERASGMTVDRGALAWWSLFNAVKGRAIWTSAWHEYVRGGRVDPVLAVSGWYTARRQDAILAAILAGVEDVPAGPRPHAGGELADVLLGVGGVTIGLGAQAGEADAFTGSTLTVSGLMAILAAAEAEQAAAWRLADIAAMRALLGLPPAPVADFGLAALDAAWATLSEALIAHHAAVEAAGDAAQDRAILAFYRESAARRDLPWPM
jgi:aminoglycoside phosphotransferase (APT) family kinase protein